MNRALVLIAAFAAALLATLVLTGCGGDLSSPSSTEQDTRGCHHGNHFCVDMGGADMAPPPSSSGDMARAPAPDMARPPTLDMAMPPPADMAKPPAPDMAIACDQPVSTTDSGHHNAGLDCSGCHDGSTATKWYVSGTLYDSVSGANAIAGATIHVVDANGQKLALVSALNGNFYTSTPVAYPITISASRCPNNAAMSGSVQAPGGCNGCHSSTFRVHLP